MLDTAQAFSEINEIYSITALNGIFKKISVDTLVIFDVDHVLIMPTDSYTRNRHPYRKILWDNIVSKNSEKKIIKLQSIVTKKAKWCLVEPKIIDILSILKNNSIPTIALTAHGTGKFGIIKKLEDLRITTLQNLGINFINLSPFTDVILLESLKNKHGIPMLKNGIIFTTEIDKALVLERILNNKNYLPKKIIFIDDQLSNIETIAKLCVKLGVQFSGFHYLAVAKREQLSINQEKEQLRFSILEREGRWLSIEELAEL